jgi:plastocyanin
MLVRARGTIGAISMRCIPDPKHLAILIVVLVTFITLCGCTGYGSSAPPATTPTQVPGAATVTLQNFAFNPASITVPKGTTVTWINQDTADHTIVNDAQGSIARGALFTSNPLPKGGSFSYTFDTPGIYPYHCSLHPSMKATVIVT